MFRPAWVWDIRCPPLASSLPAPSRGRHEERTDRLPLRVAAGHPFLVATPILPFCPVPDKRSARRQPSRCRGHRLLGRPPSPPTTSEIDLLHGLLVLLLQ